MLNAEINTHTASLKVFDQKKQRYAHLLLISHYTCNGVNDITWLQFFIKQNEISQLSMETKIFKRKYLQF